MTQATWGGVSLEGGATRKPLSPTTSVATNRPMGLSTMITAILSLLLHGVALAALLGWGGGARFELGEVQTIEVFLVESAAPASSIAGSLLQQDAPSESPVDLTPSAALAELPTARSSHPTLPTRPQQVVAKRPDESADLVPSLPAETLHVAEPLATEPEALPPQPPISEPEDTLEALLVAPLPDAPPPIKPEPPQAVGSKITLPLTPDGSVDRPEESMQVGPPKGPGDTQSAALPEGTTTADTPEGSVLNPTGGFTMPHDASGGAASGKVAVAAPGNQPPAYPNIARRRGQEGLVLLRVEVSPGGNVAAVQVAASSGHPILDRAAVNAVEDWRFQPAQRGGQNIAATLEIPVRFRLTD